MADLRPGPITIPVIARITPGRLTAATRFIAGASSAAAAGMTVRSTTGIIADTANIGIAAAGIAGIYTARAAIATAAGTAAIEAIAAAGGKPKSL